MSITVHRAMLTVAGAAVLGGLPVPAAAQVDRGIVLNILLECAKINDPTARLACYDNNIRSAGAAVAAAVPGRGAAAPRGGAAPVGNGGVAGFGRESIRTPGVQAPAGQIPRITSSLTAVAQREPGIYLLTFDDGAQWVFAQSVSSNYVVPRAGMTVEIERGSLGSYLLRVPGQPAVQVLRVR